MILTRQQVEEGERVPRGYGFAWRDFDRACMVAYPIPFNVLFRVLRRFWHWIIAGLKHSVIDEARLAGIREGQEIAERFRENQQKSLTEQINELANKKALWALKKATDANRSE